MKGLKREGLFRRMLYSKITAGLMVVFVLFMASVVWRMYGSYRETEEKMLASATRLEEAKEKKADLEQKVERLKTKEGREAELREKFLIAEEGEQVLVIVDEDEPKNNLQPLPEKKSWWEKVLSFF